jgi:hypothetical protein
MMYADIVPAPTNDLMDAHVTSPFGGRHEPHLYFSACCEIMVPRIRQTPWPGTGHQKCDLEENQSGKGRRMEAVYGKFSRESAPWRDTRGEET